MLGGYILSRRCVYSSASRTIPAKESHVLWAKSAGRCAFPECPNRCIDTFENAGTILLAEMAHILPHSSGGPRGRKSADAGINRYGNLILLCPNHHELVDKAPDDFPSDKLRQWKAELEHRVEAALDVPSFTSKEELYRYVGGVLAENKTIHDTFGPLSPIARSNPASNMYSLWQAQKIEQIIPNNANIVAAFRRFRSLVPPPEFQIYAEFEAHAVAFAASTRSRLDSVPMFPIRFAEMISRRSN